MNDEQVISIDEFRKVAGKDADQYDDVQIKELILHLDFMAQLFNKNQRSKKENEATSV
jgi:hypothetical protein